MGNVILWHGQDRNLRHRAFLADQTSSPLIEGGQVSIEVTRIPTTARHFTTSCGNFPQGFTVVGHVSHDNQNVHVLFISQVLSCCQGNPWRRNPLDSWVISQIDKEHRAVNGSCLPEVIHEEFGFFKGNPHGRKDHGEVFIRVKHGRLTGDLSS